MKPLQLNCRRTISRIENGSVEPGAGMFLRILSALGLRFEVLQPMAIG